MTTIKIPIGARSQNDKDGGDDGGGAGQLTGAGGVPAGDIVGAALAAPGLAANQIMAPMASSTSTTSAMRPRKRLEAIVPTLLRIARGTVEPMSKSLTPCVLAVAVAVAMTGCDQKDTPAPGRAAPAKPIEPGSGSMTAPGPTLAPVAEGVDILINDTVVTHVTSAQVAKWPRVDSLIPETSRRLGTWQRIVVKSASGDHDLDRPSASYPEMVPVLFPGSDGRPAFGMYDAVELAKHGKPGTQTAAVRSLRIVQSTEARGGEHQGGAPADPAALVLVIKTATGDKKLTGEQILAVPRDPAPGNDDIKGWSVNKLLAAAGITKYKRLTLIDAAGTSLPLGRDDFDDKSSVPFIKLNRQGTLRFRLMKKQGSGWQTAGDLRALSTIKVE